MTLREEKTQLKGRLTDAQHEIDSLEATLKEQESQGVGTLIAHLEGFQDQVITYMYYNN